MRPDIELHLEQQLMCRRTFRIVGMPVLSANLAELARPIRQREGLSDIVQRSVVGAFRTIEPRAREPSAAQLIVTGHVEPRGILASCRLLALTPDDFRASDERGIDGTPQRTPPHGRIESNQLGRKLPFIHAIHNSRRVVTEGIRSGDVDVGRLAEILVAANVADVAEIASLA